MEKIAICPGSFDPFTSGHKAIIDKALQVFDKIVVVVGYNITKEGYLPIDQRVRIIEKAYKDTPSLSVVAYSGLIAHFCKENNIRFIVRGIRNFSDYQFETTVSRINQQLNNELETIFFSTPAALEHVSSTLLRELIAHQADLTPFLPEGVDEEDLIR